MKPTAIRYKQEKNVNTQNLLGNIGTQPIECAW